ncbi:hypothetical protein D3C72_1507170 [compost metagenome]
MFMPPTPARRNFRPTEGIPSYRSTLIPAWLNTSAAIRPAGPPPMMATREGEEVEDRVMECAAVLANEAGHSTSPDLCRSEPARDGLERLRGKPDARRRRCVFREQARSYRDLW